jgi:putative phosphotransacetylase
MNDDDLDRLARLIADEIARGLAGPPRPEAAATWLPTPTRPEPATRTHDPAPWSGAGQSLGDIAPVRSPVASRHRGDAGEHAVAVRAAAAGAGPERRGKEKQGATTAARTRLRQGAGRLAGATVPIGVSNRHLHLSAAHVQVLFGGPMLTVDRVISQPGQFAAAERVTVAGPAGRIERVRVVGPPRGETQLELAPGDARQLGVTPPVAASGSLASSLGGVRLEGPAGSVELGRGVIVPARHLHLAPADATRLGLSDGDMLSVRCGEPGRSATLHGVLVRSGPGHATELHLDGDEALALGVATGDTAVLASRESPGSTTRRRLLTESDVVRIAGAGGAIPPGALLTPSALDRARALGVPVP